jgi:hypothetical protein
MLIFSDPNPVSVSLIFNQSFSIGYNTVSTYKNLIENKLIPFPLFGHWVDLFLGLHLISWEEGANGPEGKRKLVKNKSLRIKPQDASPKHPRESNKRLLSKEQEGPGKIIKQDLVRG